MTLRQEGCSECENTTGGDCGRHGSRLVVIGAAKPDGLDVMDMQLTNALDEIAQWKAGYKKEKAANDILRTSLKEVLDALRNMAGYFGGADIQVRLGKGFTATHAQLIQEAKDVIEKAEKEEA